jgi:hypothetical protein
MKNLTTPQAILGGLALIAIAVASLPLSSRFIQDAEAQSNSRYSPMYVEIVDMPSMGMGTVEVRPASSFGFKIRQ